MPTVDLRTGQWRESRPEDYITKAAPAVTDGDCPLWLAFLDRVMAGDRDLVAYLKRVCGYCLTGITREHVLFFLYGTGANGKSVFVSTIAGVMGDYAVTAPPEMFMASNSDRHPTELARLRGARLVVASEIEMGRRWAESLIKQITGGEKITARFMRQDFFEFTPQFKLMISGNHRPGLRGVDEAMRRRIHLIPFAVTIPPAERDPELAEKLKAEWGGILAWAIEGCLEWQRDGLSPPAAVRNATNQYLESEDSLGQWLAERCKLKAGFYSTSTELFRDWTGWANNAGEFVGSQKRFSQALLDRGLAPRQQTGTNRAGFEGIALLPRESSEEADKWEA
jgi:putative DNA primase/helicase